MTPSQIQTVQIARRQLHLDEADYRQILREVGKVSGENPSCKSLTNRSFEDVMAHFEHMGFRHVNKPEDYWRKKTFNRGIFSGSREVDLIERLSRQLPRYKLGGLCLRFSDGRVERPDQLSAKEAHQLIEMLKSAIAREGKQQPEHEPALVPSAGLPSEGLMEETYDDDVPF